MSLVGRLFNVIATPGEVFDHIKGAAVSTANWLVPGLILIAVSWLGSWLILSQDSIKQQLREITDQAIEKQIQKAHMSEQQAEQARTIGAKYGSIGTNISIVAAPVFAGFVTPFWWGLILWLAGKALKADFPYMKGVEVTGLAGMIGVLDSIVRILLILVMGNLFASPSLALFVKQFDPQNPVHGLLAVVNIMTFWVLAVRAIGLARLSGATFGKAAAWVFGIWVLLTGIMTGFGFAMKALFAR
jgi:Yip1-like protein